MLEQIAILSGHEEERVWHASWSHDGLFLATCGEDKVIRIWSIISNSSSPDLNIMCISTLEDAQTRTLRSCEWSYGDNLIASASFDGTVVVWDVQNDTGKRSWQQIACLEGDIFVYAVLRPNSILNEMILSRT
jgi:WD40 repeat protein